MQWYEFIALGLVFLGLPGALGLAVLTAAGLLGRRPPRPAVGPGPRRLAVVVPAHNEEHNVASAVASLLAAARPPAELDLIVVADNCSDSTAERARQAGARVLERVDAERRGKGFALAFGFDDALAHGADAVVVVDADSRVGPQFLVELHAAFAAGARAVQGRYEASEESGAPPQRRLARLAFAAFNVLRPRGRARLGLSAGLFGNGFGLEAALLRERPYGALSIVEDLEYHLDLVSRGVRVEYVDGARVEAPLPTSDAGNRTQRTRWEGGRLRMAALHLPRLVLRLPGAPRLVEPALDLLLLPLGLHVLLFLPALVLGPELGRSLAIGFLGLLLVHVGGVWVLLGARRADLLALLVAPFYVLRKLALLPATLGASRARAAWRRTERDRA